LQGQRSEGRRLAADAIRKAQNDVAQQGFQITRAALLLASGRPLPELPKILKAHSLIHTADGEFFRQVLAHAISECKLKRAAIKERELLSSASAKLRRRPPALLQVVSDLGKALGSPWTQDEKFATLAAWLALA
jgi:hypothetical protein